MNKRENKSYQNKRGQNYETPEWHAAKRQRQNDRVPKRRRQNDRVPKRRRQNDRVKKRRLENEHIPATQSMLIKCVYKRSEPYRQDCQW